MWAGAIDACPLVIVVAVRAASEAFFRFATAIASGLNCLRGDGKDGLFVRQKCGAASEKKENAIQASRLTPEQQTDVEGYANQVSIRVDAIEEKLPGWFASLVKAENAFFVVSCGVYFVQFAHGRVDDGIYMECISDHNLPPEKHYPAGTPELLSTIGFHAPPVPITDDFPNYWQEVSAKTTADLQAATNVTLQVLRAVFRLGSGKRLTVSWGELNEPSYEPDLET